MLLAPLGPRGKLRPEWASGPGLRDTAWQLEQDQPLLAARSALTLVLRLQSAHSPGGCPQRHMAGPIRSTRREGQRGLGAQRMPCALTDPRGVSRSVSERLLPASRSGNASRV